MEKKLSDVIENDEIVIIKRGLDLLVGGEEGQTPEDDLTKPACACNPRVLAHACDNAS
ncbi:MAG: hypothetical protein PHU27_04945 [Salinivirgaceae bacterium]|nr:hypothetical protein [Salinivirgaceae bacterium]